MPIISAAVLFYLHNFVSFFLFFTSVEKEVIIIVAVAD